jgi:hypothetical protein
VSHRRPVSTDILILMKSGISIFSFATSASGGLSTMNCVLIRIWKANSLTWWDLQEELWRLLGQGEGGNEALILGLAPEPLSCS